MYSFIFQPIEDIAKAIRGLKKSRSSKKIPRILYHTDAAQAIGKIKVDVDELGVDYLTVVGHKFYGPRIGMMVPMEKYKRDCIPPPSKYFHIDNDMLCSIY